ncbi:MAG TPA: sugar phosphate isomerase/epimerase family protein [Methylomirabilota bacterium]|jgi:sugar phosphate isomerase/epimerase
MATGLALHTWTLDTTPLAETLRVMREAGWNAIELRRLDFTRAVEAGRPAEMVIELVRASGLPVACVGVELGWMWSQGEERARLLRVFAEQCQRAVALGCATVMSPVDRGTGALSVAAASVREVGDIAGAHGLRLALEANSQAEQVNTLERLRELIAQAGHSRCGLLFDTYHFQRSGGRLAALEEVPGSEIFYVQFSDVPATGLEPGKVLNRLPPGHGVVPFKDVFRLLAAKGYTGYLSYEAPNTAAWARNPLDVAREALAATRAVLP